MCFASHKWSGFIRMPHRHECMIQFEWEWIEIGFMKVKLISIWELICVNISSYSLRCNGTTYIRRLMCVAGCVSIATHHKDDEAHLYFCSVVLAENTQSVSGDFRCRFALFVHRSPMQPRAMTHFTRFMSEVIINGCLLQHKPHKQLVRPSWKKNRIFVSYRTNSLRILKMMWLATVSYKDGLHKHSHNDRGDRASNTSNCYACSIGNLFGVMSSFSVFVFLAQYCNSIYRKITSL